MRRARLLNRFQKQAKSRRDKARTRFPLLFGMLASFGLAAVFYGFNELIKKISLFVDNPWIIFAAGIFILLLSGTAYKKLN